MTQEIDQTCCISKISPEKYGSNGVTIRIIDYRFYKVLIKIIKIVQ